MWNTIDNLLHHHMTIEEWKHVTGPHVTTIEKCIQPTSHRAYCYPCPRLTAEGCPRRIIETAGGYQAICGHKEKRCNPIALSSAETLIYELDYTKLNEYAAAQLGIPSHYIPLEHDTMWQAGYYNPIGHQRFAVYMILALSQEQFCHYVYYAAALSREPFIIITPTHKYITPTLENTLTLHNACFIALQDGVKATDDKLKTFLRRNVPQYTDRPTPGSFPTPAGLRWEQLTLRFEADDVITVKWQGHDATIVDRMHIPGMYNSKSGTKKETSAWSLLKLFAKHHGLISPGDQHMAHIVQKQKQLLCSRLKEYFMLDDNPIIWSHKENGYRTRFVVHFDPCLIWSGRESIK